MLDVFDARAGADNVSRMARWKLWTLLAATALMAALVLLHAPYLDGPWYSRWGWHRAQAYRYYSGMAIAAVPFALAVTLFRRRIAFALPALMLSVAGFALWNSANLEEDVSLKPMIWLIESPDAGSYFADAAALMPGPGTVRDWLAHWHELMPQMYLHSREKPPGPVLFHAAFIHFFGITDRAAFAAGLAIALLVSLAVPATYALARSLGAARDAALASAACLAAMPSLSLFFPALDACYIVLTCALIGLWATAISRNSMRFAIAFGLTLALTTFITYNVLVLGALLLALGLYLSPRRIPRHAAIAIAVFVACYAVLWLITGFDPIATFRAALANQSHLAAQWNRPWPWTVLFDLTDFALGVGWVTLLLVGCFLAAPPHVIPNEVRDLYVDDATSPKRFLASLGMTTRGELLHPIALLFLAEILLTALTGLLPAETARVWAFLTPLIAIPAGAELARWPARPRLIAYACLMLILFTLGQNLLAGVANNAMLLGGH